MVQQPKLTSDTFTFDEPKGRYFIFVMSKECSDQGCTGAGLYQGLSDLCGSPFCIILKRTKRVNVLRVQTIMKKFLLMLALLGVLGFSSQANAGVHVGIGIGVGPVYGGPYYGGYYGGYPYYGYPGPYYYGYGGPSVYFGPGYYPWYRGYWHGGYYRGGYGHGGYYHHR
jgi:hypothetical protein